MTVAPEFGTGGLYEFIERTNLKPESEPLDDFWSQLLAWEHICLSCGNPNVLIEQPFPGWFAPQDICYDCSVAGGD